VSASLIAMVLYCDRASPPSRAFVLSLSSGSFRSFAFMEFYLLGEDLAVQRISIALQNESNNISILQAAALKRTSIRA
jgi:hypothetical protein